MFDTILRNGLIIDGTGRAAYGGDIGVTGDSIAAIGDLSDADAAEVIDVAGFVVAPGFIDIHTHSDAVLLADGRADSQVLQGVTSELGGQCGFSFAPVRDASAMERWMIGRLPGVNVAWSSFGEYLDVLERQDLGVNFLAHVGHGALRAAVMGDEKRAIRSDEIAAMERLLDASLDEGAWGMSTGLEYWPGLGATTDELAQLCAIVSAYGAMHATHVRNRDRFYDLGFGEALAIGRVANVRTQISHIQPKYGRPAHAMAHTLGMIDHARSIGVDVAFDIIPHDWSHTGVASMLPSWAREGGVEKLLHRLGDPGMRLRLRDNPTPMWRIVLDEHWDKVYFLRASNKQIIGRSVAEIASERDRDAWDTIFDLLLEEGEDALHMLWTSQSFFEEDLEMALRHDQCAVMSDTMALGVSGPTVDLIGSLSGFDWTVRFLKTYVQDKALLSIEDGIRRITGLPAERIGLKDRGRLGVGMKADLVVLDLASLGLKGSIAEPKRHPSGVRHVVLNGMLAVRDGERCNVSSGRILRRGA
ncbi:MAG: N-acyl-D-amino-acid deacylase family protein [Salinarimonas sp.]